MRGGAGCITALAPPPLLLSSGLGAVLAGTCSSPRSGAKGPWGSQMLCCPLRTPSRRFLRF